MGMRPTHLESCDCMQGTRRRVAHQAQGKLKRTWEKYRRCMRMAVREQLGGSADSRVWKISNDEKKCLREEWKKKVEYGKRWLVEIVFSAFKRMFGEEHLYSLKWKNMGAGSQDQGGRVQQDGGHGGRSGVVEDM